MMNNSSNDSGLDESVSVTMATPNSLSTAATRLSWFLAEVDDGTLSGSRPNGQKRLVVLHSMELQETNVSEKYMSRSVDFRFNGVDVQAKLLLASDERRLVDAAMIELTKDNCDEIEDIAQDLLLQYTEETSTGQRLIQKMISQKYVELMCTPPEVSCTPLVRLGDGNIANVLFAHEHRGYMEKVLLHVKARCFDLAFIDNLEATLAPMTEQSWLLIQYSPDPYTVIYQVIPFSDTVWREENLFKDVIAYIQPAGYELVLQAVVITYGPDPAELMETYEQLRVLTLKMEFPMPQELEEELRDTSCTAALFAQANTTLFNRGEERDESGDHRQERQNLEEMNEFAVEEADMIIDAFEVIEGMTNNLTSDKDKLNPDMPSTSSGK